jgi:hypothetical protein
MSARLLRAALAALVLAIPGAPARAQAPQLYELRLPDGYALVRYVNGTELALSLRSDFDLPRQLGTDNAARVTPFHVVERVEGRQLEMDVAGPGLATRLAFTARPNTFNTVLFLREGNALVARAVEDTTEFNQLRARLTFYNAALGCGTATLALDPGNRAVVADVGAAAMRARTVAPAAARVATSCAGARVGPLDLGRLEAGQLVSVWLMAPGGTPVLFTSRDVIAPPGR